MGKIDENKQQKKERLLDMAFQLFTTKGINKTSISDIVNDAGVAKGTFYLYFQDKYDLANKLIARKTHMLFAHAFERMNQLDIAAAEDKIIFIVDDILDQLQKNHRLLRFITKNLSWGVFTNVQEESDYQTMLNSILGPDLDSWRDPDTMFYIIIELVGSSSYSVILNQDPLPMDQFKPHLYSSIRAIVRNFHTMPDCGQP